MAKYKLLGITQYAWDNLCQEDIDSLIHMIGSGIEENAFSCENGRMFRMPDGISTHIDFLEVEIITPITPIIEEILKLVEQTFSDEISSSCSETCIGLESYIDGKDQFMEKLAEKLKLVIDGRKIES